MEILQYYKNLHLSLQNPKNIDIPKLKKDITDRLNEELQKNESLEKDKLERKTYLLQKKKSLLKKKKLILEDSINQYWIKEKKYKYPPKIIDLNEKIKKNYNYEKNLEELVVILQEQNKHLNFQINDARKNIPNMKNLIHHNEKKLELLETTLEKNIESVKQSYNNNNTQLLLFIDLFNYHEKLWDKKYINACSLAYRNYEETVLNTETQILVLKHLIESNARKINSIEDGHEINFLAVQNKNYTLNSKLLKNQLDKINEEYQQNKTDLLEAYQLNLKTNYLEKQKINKKKGLLKINFNESCQNLSHNIQMYHDKIIEINEIVAHQEKIIYNCNKEINNNNSKIEESQKKIGILQDLTPILKQKHKLLSEKIVTQYKYYMNFYTTTISDLKNDIYVINLDIEKIQKDKNIDELENNKINILKKILESIDTLNNNE